MSSTTILSAKPSFSLKRSPNPLIRCNWLSLKTSHSCLRLAPRMRLAGIAFCEAPYNAATHLVVQDDLDALLQVRLCSNGFLSFLHFSTSFFVRICKQFVCNIHFDGFNQFPFLFALCLFHFLPHSYLN